LAAASSGFPAVSSWPDLGIPARGARLGRFEGLDGLVELLDAQVQVGQVPAVVDVAGLLGHLGERVGDEGADVGLGLDDLVGLLEDDRLALVAEHLAVGVLVAAAGVPAVLRHAVERHGILQILEDLHVVRLFLGQLLEDLPGQARLACLQVELAQLLLENQVLGIEFPNLLQRHDGDVGKPGPLGGLDEQVDEGQVERIAPQQLLGDEHRVLGLAVLGQQQVGLDHLGQQGDDVDVVVGGGGVEFLDLGRAQVFARPQAARLLDQGGGQQVDGEIQISPLKGGKTLVYEIACFDRNGFLRDVH
jgi:hypothetical protein